MDPTQDNSKPTQMATDCRISRSLCLELTRSANNPLNLPTITNGTVLSNYAQLPLVGIGAGVPTPPLTLFENGIPAPNTSLSQGPDGLWSINWDTSHLTNGVYSIQVAMQYGHNSSGPVLYGTEKRGHLERDDVRFANKPVHLLWAYH